MGDNNTYIVKCIILGDYGNGKTSYYHDIYYNKSIDSEYS